MATSIIRGCSFFFVPPTSEPLNLRFSAQSPTLPTLQIEYIRLFVHRFCLCCVCRVSWTIVLSACLYSINKNFVNMLVNMLFYARSINESVFRARVQTAGKARGCGSIRKIDKCKRHWLGSVIGDCHGSIAWEGIRSRLPVLLFARSDIISLNCEVWRFSIEGCPLEESRGPLNGTQSKYITHLRLRTDTSIQSIYM